MPIVVEHKPSPLLVGSVARDAGAGEYAQRQEAQAIQTNLQLAGMAQRERMAAQEMQARQQSQVFSQQADLQRMGFGAAIEGGQRRQEFDFRNKQLEDQQQHALEQQKQEAALREEFMLKNLDAESKQKWDNLERERATIESAEIEDDAKEWYRNQWLTKAAGAKETWPAHQLPPELQPGKRYVSGGIEFITDPKGEPKKLGFVDPIEKRVKPLLHPLTEKPIIDQNTGQPSLYYVNSRGDPTLLETAKVEKPVKPLITPEAFSTLWNKVAENIAGPSGTADPATVTAKTKQILEAYQEVVGQQQGGPQDESVFFSAAAHQGHSDLIDGIRSQRQKLYAIAQQGGGWTPELQARDSALKAELESQQLAFANTRQVAPPPMAQPAGPAPQPVAAPAAQPITPAPPRTAQAAIDATKAMATFIAKHPPPPAGPPLTPAEKEEFIAIRKAAMGQ